MVLPEQARELNSSIFSKSNNNSLCSLRGQHPLTVAASSSLALLRSNLKRRCGAARPPGASKTEFSSEAVLVQSQSGRSFFLQHTVETEWELQPFPQQSEARLQIACSHFGNVLYRAMRIIARNTLVNFWSKHPGARGFAPTLVQTCQGRPLGLNG